MAQENVELVRRLTEAYNRRDLDAMLAEWAPDAVLDWSNARSFDAGVYRGRGEIRAFIERFLVAWDEVRTEFVDHPGRGRGGPLDRRERRLHARTRRHRGGGSKRVVDHDPKRRADLAHAVQTKREALEAAGLAD